MSDFISLENHNGNIDFENKFFFGMKELIEWYIME
jgi:hypothetical protein